MTVSRRTLLGAGLVAGGLGVAGWSLAPLLGEPEGAPLPPADFDVPDPTPDVAQMVEVARLGVGRVTIPRLGVDARLVETGVRGGELLLPPPEQITHAINSAALDAVEGTYLMAGHVSARGVAGALKWASKLQAGDLFHVRDQSGVFRSWVVSGMQTVIKADLPDDLWHTTGERRAAMVTCGGPVVRRANGQLRYRDNVIVYGLPI